MRELIKEVFASIKNNKMRTALTGLAMSWGVFILIVLISSGNGILNGMDFNFRAYNFGMVTLTTRETSLPSGGRKPGWPVYLYESDCDWLKQVFGDTITKVIPVISNPVQVHRGKYHTNTAIDGYEPGYAPAPNVELVEGRDINDLDLIQMRKVCLIPGLLKQVLFPEDKASVVGHTLIINGVHFKIIGVYEPLLKENKTRKIVAPLTTVKQIFSPHGRLSNIYLQTNHLATAELNLAFNKRIVNEVAHRKGFNPSDIRAIKIDNIFDLPVLITTIISALYVFVTVVGLATLISAIVGISNIMLISVKERTHEIGIRRALGADDKQIVTMVMSESVAISAIFGYMGMVIGVFLMELVARIVEQTGNSNLFSNPTISISNALVIMFIMVLAGVIAGYVPAKHAVNIEITEALSKK
ncbi:MAG: ABC transporter permease [Bacteroidaceae bacterium]|nr:ABC transporter permease [Bacteroidaceae bacterium]